jgi:thiamine biosynthesis lipoprotein
LNAARGKPTIVSADTYTVIEHAVTAWRHTAGRFDPTVLSALRASGYDRSFDELTRRQTVVASSASPCPGCDGIELVPELGLVRLPPGVQVDLGGIGKGAAADLVAAELLGAGATGACVNVGGDVRVAGAPPTSAGWVVGLECPAPRPPVRAVALADGAVCTSTTLIRRWETTAGPRHHLIDPRTGSPVSTDLVSVTVIGARAVQAEVLTKVAFVAGSHEAPSLLAAYGVTAVLVSDDGSIAVVGDLEEMAA